MRKEIARSSSLDSKWTLSLLLILCLVFAVVDIRAIRALERRGRVPLAQHLAQNRTETKVLRKSEAKTVLAKEQESGFVEKECASERRRQLGAIHEKLILEAERRGLYDKSYRLPKEASFGLLFRVLRLDGEQQRRFLHELRLNGVQGSEAALPSQLSYEFRRQAAACIAIGWLQNRLATVGDQLSEGQALQLESLLVNSAGSKVAGPVQLGSAMPIAADLVVQTESFLSPNQRSVLRDVSALIAARDALNRLKARVYAGN